MMKVFTREEWDYSKNEIGDFVDEAVVWDMLECVPPRTMTYGLAQCGEPYSTRFDEKTGKWRTTYGTFRRVVEHTWEYCGDCFAGEDTQRGKEPSYIALGRK